MVHLVIEFGFIIKRNDLMKLLLFILLFCSSTYSQSQDKIPANIQKKLDEAVDYYNLYLFDESKKLLLELLYSDEGDKYEAEIRYHLGIASHTEGLSRVAGKQWTILRKKYPTSSRAKEISRVFSTIMQEHQGDSLFEHESFEFREEIRYSNLFWDPKYATRKMFYGELIEPGRAVEYYEKLLKPDLKTYKKGIWETEDFDVNDKRVQVKSTKYFGNLLLIETKNYLKDENDIYYLHAKEKKPTNCLKFK